MAKIPDSLLKDILKHLDSWQKVNNEAEKDAEKLIYAIKLTAVYDNE